MKITSPAFSNNETFPAKYGCSGEGVNPPLEISDVPAGAVSLVLISDDPDAPSGDFVHWLVWNIDPATTQIAENSVPVGAIQGSTSMGEPGYVAPCPPSGTHHYHFKIYALDTKLDLPTSANKAKVLSAMEGHVLAQGEIIGLYSR